MRNRERWKGVRTYANRKRLPFCTINQKQLKKTSTFSYVSVIRRLAIIILLPRFLLLPRFQLHPIWFRLWRIGWRYYSRWDGGITIIRRKGWFQSVPSDRPAEKQAQEYPENSPNQCECHCDKEYPKPTVVASCYQVSKQRKSANYLAKYLANRWCSYYLTLLPDERRDLLFFFHDLIIIWGYLFAVERDFTSVMCITIFLLPEHIQLLLVFFVLFHQLHNSFPALLHFLPDCHFTVEKVCFQLCNSLCQTNRWNNNRWSNCPR